MAGGSQTDKASKTEKPTKKKIKDAREQGQIPRTQELVANAGILTASYLIPWVVSFGYRRLIALWQRLDDAVSAAAVGDLSSEGVGLVSFFGSALAEFAILLAPIAITLVVLAIAGNLAQTGWAFSTKKLKPRPDKLNPLKGIKNLLGPHIFWELAKNLIKVGLIGVMAWPRMQEVATLLLSAGRPGVGVIGAAAADAAIAFVRAVGLVGLVVAAIDYTMQRRKIMNQLKMSKQEIKDEHKQQEGDPQMKGQRRARMMAMSRNRMMAAVPDADVVIVNPTHLSIAIVYDAETRAPKVVAKGAGQIALRIREIAKENNLPVVHDKPLARTIYRLVEIDQAIPVELYEAVARVLAFVYTLRRKGQAAGWHESPFAAAHESLTDLGRPQQRQEAALTG